MVGERAMTVEEFERIAPLLDSPSELVDGRLRLMSPANYRHGILTAKIAHILESFVEVHPELGEVVGAQTGFRISNPRYPVQAPDAGFVRADRVPEDSEGEDSPMDHFMVGAPDLAVEVRSPSERLAAVRRKAERWLAAGCAEVWIIDSQCDIVHVLRSAAEPLVLHPDDTLATPQLLPGFSVRVADIFSRRRVQ